MVREEQDTVLHAFCVQFVKQRLQDPGIQPLDGLDLTGKISIVGALIRCFQMDTAKVRIGMDQIQCRPKLSFKIGIDLAGGTFHLDHFKAPQNANSMAQGDRGDHAAGVSVLSLEVRQFHRGALRPEPDAVGRHFSGAASLFIKGVAVQHAVGNGHKFFQNSGIFTTCGQVLPCLLSQVVVGRDQADALDIRTGLDRQLSEGRGAVNDHTGLLLGCAKLRIALQNIHHPESRRSVDTAGTVGEDALFLIGHLAVFQGDDITAIGNITGSKTDAGSSRFHGRAACKPLPGITAKNGKDGSLAACGQGLRAVDGVTHHAL